MGVLGAGGSYGCSNHYSKVVFEGEARARPDDDLRRSLKDSGLVIKTRDSVTEPEEWISHKPFSPTSVC